jgi:hypothetical protein
MHHLLFFMGYPSVGKPQWPLKVNGMATSLICGGEQSIAAFTADSTGALLLLLLLPGTLLLLLPGTRSINVLKNVSTKSASALTTPTTPPKRLAKSPGISKMSMLLLELFMMVMVMIPILFFRFPL